MLNMFKCLGLLNPASSWVALNRMLQKFVASSNFENTDEVLMLALCDHYTSDVFEDLYESDVPAELDFQAHRSKSQLSPKHQRSGMQQSQSYLISLIRQRSQLRKGGTNIATREESKSGSNQKFDEALQ